MEVTMMSQGVCMLYSFFMGKDKREERMNMNISDIVQKVRLPCSFPVPLNAFLLLSTFRVRFDLYIDDVMEYYPLLSDRGFETGMILPWVLHCCVGHGYTNQELSSGKSSLERFLKKKSKF